MRFDRIAAFCAASVIAATFAPAVGETHYDGKWQVTIVTKPAPASRPQAPC